MAIKSESPTSILHRHFALLLSLSVFVVIALAGTAIVGQSKDFGNGCEWDPDTWEVVCEDTPTPTPVPPTDTPTPIRPTITPTTPPPTPTDTPVRPTDTPVRPTDTPVPPTITPTSPPVVIIEPTATPTPTDKPTDPPPPGLPTPTPEIISGLPEQGNPSLVAYRWIAITWVADPVYVSFEIEADDEGAFKKLPEVFNGLPSSGRRAQINHVNRTANIRGIAYNSTTPVVFRVTGITRGNARRTSAEFSILQDNLPLAVGHQHDHTSAYDLSRLQTDTHGNNIGLATARAARLWNALPDVSMCHISSCTTNDGSAGRIYVESYTFDTCKPGVACVLAFNRIEGQITDTTVRYETTPHSSKIDYLWTTNIGDHLTDVNPGDSSLRYVHVATIVLHEMGHTLGMPDFNSPTTASCVTGRRAQSTSRIRTGDT